MTSLWKVRNTHKCERNSILEYHLFEYSNVTLKSYINKDRIFVSVDTKSI